MAGDLKVGTTYEKGPLEDGITQTVETIREASKNIVLSFDEIHGRSKAALLKMSSDVKEMAQVVSTESLRVAEATKVYNIALADQRRALFLTRDAKISDATSWRFSPPRSRK